MEGLSSKIGIARQTAKGTQNVTVGNFHWLLSNSIVGGPAPRQQALPTEIGGSLFNRGLVKLGVSALAAADFIPRPVSVGALLYGIMGVCTSTQLTGDDDYHATGLSNCGLLTGTLQTGRSAAQTAVPGGDTYLTVTCTRASYAGTATWTASTLVIRGTDVADQAITETFGAITWSAGQQTQTLRTSQKFKTISAAGLDFPAGANNDTVKIGPYKGTQHVFTINSTAPGSIPYYTMLRRVDASFWEKGVDMRMESLSLVQNALSWLSGSFTMNGITPSQLADADTTTYTAAATLEDSRPVFVAPSASFQLTSSYKTSDSTLPCRGVQVTIGAAQDIDREFVIGSYYPQDVDVLARIASISGAVFVTDRVLYNKLMYKPSFTGSTSGTAWDPSVFESATMAVQYSTAQYMDGAVASTSSTGDDVLYTLNIAATKTLWAASPIAVRGNDIVVMQVTGAMTQPDSGEPLTITLVNNKDGY
jgi:hypothetical protein